MNRFRINTMVATAISLTFGVQQAHAAVDPTLGSWIQNTTGATGHSTDTTINNAVSSMLANVQQVRYTSTDVYINSTSIPSYDIGPFPGDPNVPADQHSLLRIPRNPTLAANNSNTAVGGGPVGLLVNGVHFFNAQDADTYNNLGIWHQNAAVVEASSFDAGNGHPQQQGDYHVHQQPTLLSSALGDNGTHVSPILGYAFDGFPVYGPYMYANPDGTGGVKRMVSSFQLRSLTNRNTVVHVNPDGSNTTTNVTPGPNVSAQYPLGYYVEDYQYVAGSGDLNQFNLRFTDTPEYPNGTWAYFTTIDATGKSAYPYIVGPYYGGVVAGDDTTHPASTVVVPGNAVVYSVPEPGACALMGITFGAALMRRRARMNAALPSRTCNPPV